MFLAGLLFVDNLVLVPAGGDHLRFGLRGRFRYDAGSRMQARQRDLVLLNPLNPFDRIALTQRHIGNVSAAQWRASRRMVRVSLSASNQLSFLGSVYLLVLCCLALASLEVYFGFILLALGVAHLVTWLLAVWTLLRKKVALGLDNVRIFALASEALFVPGYLVNLGKRVWFKNQLDLAGLTLGIRQLKRMPFGGDHDLYHLRLTRRLAEIADDWDLGDASEDEVHHSGTSPLPGIAHEPASSVQQEGTASSSRSGLKAWIREARQCLMTSANAEGSDGAARVSAVADGPQAKTAGETEEFRA